MDILAAMKDSPTFGREEVKRVLGAATGSGAAEFRRVVDELQRDSSSNPGLKVRAGIGYFYLGQPDKAAEALEGCKDGHGRYIRGQALSTLGEHDAAAAEFDEAIKLGENKVECTLRKAGEVRKQLKLDEAEQIIRSTGAEGARQAEYSYQMGCVMADRGDTYGAIEYFERAVDMDPHHQRALFALALQAARQGNDDEAIQLYERCLSKPPYYLGALLNLGLLYEDKENYGAAQYCFERVLRYDPNNEWALLYLKDIEATSSMYYDEETLKQQQKLEHLLSRPVTDFELSVRSRNCLAGMDIRTLGDLTRITEPELLAGKNFGETSLKEVRELMALHGLKIGQNINEKAHDAGGAGASDFRDLSPEEQAVLQTPIADLNLSVRSRKCMTRLNITTAGELCQRTPDELMGAKNFGVTSLNEVRAKLSELGLRLRND
ncbi:MAG: DNA-directed RNA polymerase subunit alpha C-terminal domain-containing protein [Planctomycetaceae bacterium]